MFVRLDNRALIRLTGKDSESFLQSQLSNDVNKLDNSSIQLSAYCQHQGKILVLFWLLRSKDDFLLSFPLDLIETVKNRLQMFILVSDVKIEDVTEKYLQLGLINENKADAYVLNGQLSLMLVDSQSAEKFTFASQHYWDKACIDNLIPEVNSLTTEKFVPQMLNLDIDEIGVSFTKGCYPGQEVVARLHYLGKVKRRLFVFKSVSEIKVGDDLFCPSSKSARTCGSVVFQVKFKADYFCLATLEVAHKDDQIYLNNEQGPTLTRINYE
jgi:folate-binding protein YgfZ